MERKSLLKVLYLRISSLSAVKNLRNLARETHGKREIKRGTNRPRLRGTAI